MNVDTSLRDHLADCPERLGEVARCDWCRWAGSSPAIESLNEVITDCRRLRASEGWASVAGIMAVRRLTDLLAAWTPDSAPNNSAAALARGLQERAISELDGLGHEIFTLLAPGGAVNESALRTAAMVATLALQDQRWQDLCRHLPTELSTRIAGLARQASPETQLSMIATTIEGLHCPELPRLSTQPEWERRRNGRRRVDALPSDGSLEALVLESLWADHDAELLEISRELVALPSSPAVTLHRPGTPHPEGRTRALVWRLTHIDWHASLADTGWVQVPGSSRPRSSSLRRMDRCRRSR